MDKKLNYKSLRLKAGLELHQQLDTKKKLFCSCPTEMKAKVPSMIVSRKQHVVRSELGEADVAAQFEYLRDRTFNYQVFPQEVCLVCLDEEPPHEINKEALDVALQIAFLLNCETIPSELHVMRKIVIDGSSPMGFQRTVVVGLNGHLSYKGKRIPISQITLEEDAGAIVEEKNGITYRLNRVGVPLVEIDTGILEGFSPEELQEIAYLMGIMARSTNKTKTGIGAIRQDVNVSIRNGQRVEVKGVQELSLLSKVIEFEVHRQMKEHAKPETRGANPDGTTRFLRPLPGSDRMYPETDIPPVVIRKEYLDEIKKNLPEPLLQKLNRFKSKFKLSASLAEEILGSEYLHLFEKIVEKSKVEPQIVANTFTSVIKDLVRREKIEVNRIQEHRFLELFSDLEQKKIIKEAIPEIIKYLAAYPQNGVSDAIRELDLKPLTHADVKTIAEGIISSQPNLTFEKVYGIVMSKVRGKIDPQDVMNVVKALMKKQAP